MEQPFKVEKSHHVRTETSKLNILCFGRTEIRFNNGHLTDFRTNLSTNTGNTGTGNTDTGNNDVFKLLNYLVTCTLK